MARPFGAQLLGAAAVSLAVVGAVAISGYIAGRDMLAAAGLEHSLNAVQWEPGLALLVTAGLLVFALMGVAAISTACSAWRIGVTALVVITMLVCVTLLQAAPAVGTAARAKLATPRGWPVFLLEELTGTRVRVGQFTWKAPAPSQPIDLPTGCVPYTFLGPEEDTVALIDPVTSRAQTVPGRYFFLVRQCPPPGPSH